MKHPLFLTCGKDNLVNCSLCSHKCKIKNGCFGTCGVRGNKGGTGIIPFYGFITALAMDPIEKKPLYHFKPGSKILSLGFAGCNLKCPFCQNWHISQNTDVTNGNPAGKFMKPGEIISAALEHNSPSIAYTYSEPLIHFEFLIDCMSLARKHGIANVLVTNGCINSSEFDSAESDSAESNSPSAKILALTDAANIDLKSFSSETYKKVLNGDLQTVLDFIKLAYSMSVHIEVTTLVVPELNDSEDELTAIAEFIVSIEKTGSRAIPWHLTAYHPDYRWNAPPTNPAFLRRTAEDARKMLKHVHTGNI